MDVTGYPMDIHSVEYVQWISLGILGNRFLQYFGYILYKTNRMTFLTFLKEGGNGNSLKHLDFFRGNRDQYVKMWKFCESDNMRKEK